MRGRVKEEDALRRRDTGPEGDLEAPKKRRVRPNLSLRISYS